MNDFRQQATHVRRKWAEYRTLIDNPATSDSVRATMAHHVDRLDAEATRLDVLATEQATVAGEKRADVAARVVALVPKDDG